jgi:Zn2+/Cd2+-exporting ATPase
VSQACCGGTCERPNEPARARRHSGLDRQAVLMSLAGALIAAGMAANYAGFAGTTVASLSAMAAALTIGTPLRRAIKSLGRRVLDINVLMVIAVVGAAALGDWIEAAAVVWLFSIAQWLESWSMARARRAIRSLAELAPSSATIRRRGVEFQIPASDVVVGDLVIVRPGERIPVDAVVAAGESDVNQASVTGESFPAEKQAGDEVFAGSINGMGALELTATRVASDSTIARIIHLVEEAQSQRAPIQRFVDRFAQIYTPAVVFLAIAVAFLVPLAVAGPGGWIAAFPTWSYRALALLVVACPCALVISTPVSIVSALTAAARAGVLIKGGAHLERLGSITCVAFDKTGTLTEAQVTIAEVVGVNGHSMQGVLSVAAALEARSEHPIGRAIVHRALAAGLDVAPGESFRALPGLGAEATVAATPAIVGSHRLFEQRQICTPTLHARVEEVEARGGTAVLVSSGGQPLGVIALTDRLREDGRQIVRRLRSEGVRHVALLTGDRAASASAIRDEATLDEAHGDLLPRDKVDHIVRLRAAHGPVAMVGDGVNDAPALAAADVGIAMGAAGTDVALETADVALLADDLSRLPYALRLGRATLANIRLNLAIALGLKLAFVAMAALGVATLWMAVLADTGASLIVTANSLRLLKVR